MREFRGLSIEELASRTGMPSARFIGEENKRLADAIAAALNVQVDLLMD